MSSAAMAAGAVLVLVTWLSVMRAVFIPRGAAPLSARLTASLIGQVIFKAASRLPDGGRKWLANLCAPVILIATAAGWLVWSAAGFVLLWWGSAGAPRGAYVAAVLAAPRQWGAASILVGVLAALSALLLLAAVITYFGRVTDAYSRRERPVVRLAAQAPELLDAERMLLEYLRTSSPELLGLLYGQWAAWFADVRSTHTGYPAMAYYQSVGEVCWIRAATVILDSAALAIACLPDWAPPGTHALLTVGDRCLQDVAAQLSVRLPPVPVSYHGREGTSFSTTIAQLRDAGLPVIRDDVAARDAFHQLRVRYAPYANAITEFLLCDLGSYHPGPLPPQPRPGHVARWLHRPGTGR
jgi:hypothetical protein